VKTAKEFVAFERTILRTEDVLLGMERAMSELTEMYLVLVSSFIFLLFTLCLWLLACPGRTHCR